MSGRDDIDERVQGCVRRFLDSSGRDGEVFTARTNLHSGLGLSSEEGLDLVLDLCAEFNFDFPGDFNPVVHHEGNRGNSVAELAAQVRHHLTGAGIER